MAVAADGAASCSAFMMPWLTVGGGATFKAGLRREVEGC